MPEISGELDQLIGELKPKKRKDFRLIANFIINPENNRNNLQKLNIIKQNVEALGGTCKYTQDGIAIFFNEETVMKNRNIQELFDIGKDNKITSTNSTTKQHKMLLKQEHLNDNNLLKDVLLKIAEDEQEKDVIEEIYREQNKSAKKEANKAITTLSVFAGIAAFVGLIVLATSGAFLPLLFISAIAIGMGGLAYTIKNNDPNGTITKKINNITDKVINGIKTILGKNKNKNRDVEFDQKYNSREDRKEHEYEYEKDELLEEATWQEQKEKPSKKLEKTKKNKEVPTPDDVLLSDTMKIEEDTSVQKKTR